MADISKLEQQADYIANNIEAWETLTISGVANKIGKIGKLTDEEIKAFNLDEETEKEWKRIVSALSVAVLADIKILKPTYTDELQRLHEQNKPLYDYRSVDFVDVENNKQIQTIINSYSKANAKDILNITQTKALCIVDDAGEVVHLKDAIYKSFGKAVETVKSGKTDFYSAMRDTVKNLGGSGVKVDYGEGITRRLDTVVRQNMLWGVKQAHREYNDIIEKELQTNGIEIDYHSNSRPSHRYMQGKQYAKGEAQTVNGIYYPSAEKEGVYDRLYKDYGCRHYETNIILGVSVPRYTEAEIKQFKEQDEQLYTINGIKKDGYGWSQSMRNLEAETRNAKDQINALKAFGNSETQIADLNKKIKAYKQKYNKICDVTGIRPDFKRMSAPRKPKT
jgi:hypothetical protein